MKTEEDNEFIRWVHRARHPSRVLALRDSASVTNVRLESKLRYEYANRKSQGRLRSRPVRYAPVSQHESDEATSVMSQLVT